MRHLLGETRGESGFRLSPRRCGGEAHNTDLNRSKAAAMEEPRPNLLENLLRIAPHTEVVHHIPGRIRLRVLLSGLNVVKGIDLEGMIGVLPGIKGVRINAIVGSVVIQYDSEKLPYSFWEQLRQVREKPQLVEQLREHLQCPRLGSCDA